MESEYRHKNDAAVELSVSLGPIKQRALSGAKLVDYHDFLSPGPQFVFVSTLPVAKLGVVSLIPESRIGWTDKQRRSSHANGANQSRNLQQSEWNIRSMGDLRTIQCSHATFAGKFWQLIPAVHIHCSLCLSGCYDTMI